LRRAEIALPTEVGVQHGDVHASDIDDHASKPALARIHRRLIDEWQASQDERPFVVRVAAAVRGPDAGPVLAGDLTQSIGIGRRHVLIKRRDFLQQHDIGTRASDLAGLAPRIAVSEMDVPGHHSQRSAAATAAAGCDVCRWCPRRRRWRDWC
jgi:hypothetical protein